MRTPMECWTLSIVVFAGIAVSAEPERPATVRGRSSLAREPNRLWVRRRCAERTEVAR